MIDERTLSDPSVCPACRGLLAGPGACPTCGAPLDGELAARVWRVSVDAARLLAERADLVALLRTQARIAYAGAAPAAAAFPPAVMPSPPPAAFPPAPLPRPAPEWTRHRVQNLLLGLGVLLLAVAAVIFVVVSWGHLGVGGRAAIMATLTVLAATAAVVTRRRGLTATAEAVALLTVGLGLVDAYGARASGLAGLDAAGPLAYWSGALAVVAGLAGAGAVALPLRSLRLSAAVLGQLPVPLLALHHALRVDQPAAVLATGLAAQALAGVAVTAGWPARGDVRDAWRAVAGGTAAAWVLAVSCASAAAYLETGSVVLGSLLLVLLAATAAAAAVTIPLQEAARTVVLGAATVAGVLGLWAPVVDATQDEWLPVACAAVGLALLLASAGVPAAYRRPVSAVALAAAVLPAPAVADAVLLAVGGPLDWLGRPWQGHAGDARQLVSPDLGWDGGPEVPLLMLVVGAAVAVAGLVVPAWRASRPAVVPLGVLAVLTLPLALDTSYVVALGTDLAAAAALLAGGPVVAGPRRARLGWTAAGCGGALLATTAAWSFAVEEATLVVLAVAAAVALLACLGWARAGASRAVRAGAGVAAVLLAVADAAAFARHGGAGWAAVWSLVLALTGLAAVVGATVVRVEAARRVLALVALGALIAEAGTLTWWGGGAMAEVGLAVCVAASVAAVAAVWSRSRVPVGLVRTAEQLALLAAAGAGLGVLLAAADGDRLWLALLAAGVAAGLSALDPGLRPLGWVSGALLTASSWVRLVLADVTAPEPYTVPGGLALLVVGALRRRADPAYRSWPAYGPGLTLVLVPSLLRAVTDPGTARPLLLGLAALAVLCAGAVRRLQAPLLLGGGVLAVDALVQLSPYLADLYAAVPRWVFLALAGLLLVVLGATYERRVQQMRVLRQRVSGLG